MRLGIEVGDGDGDGDGDGGGVLAETVGAWQACSAAILQPTAQETVQGEETSMCGMRILGF